MSFFVLRSVLRPEERFSTMAAPVCVGAFVLSMALACVAADVGPRQDVGGFEADRRRMVDEQLGGRDIRDRRVLDAMRRIPRHEFVPESERYRAYVDSPLPIGADQTISQPYIVAFMTQAL